MKTVLSLLVILGLTLSPAAAAILSKDAAGHFGESGVVRGTVVQVSTVGAMTFLNFGQAYPNSEFTAVVRSGAEGFGDLTRWQGQEVEVSGTISSFRNRPQIEVSAPANLRAVGSEALANPAAVNPAPTQKSLIPPTVDSGSMGDADSTTPPTSTGAAAAVSPAFDAKGNARLLEGRINFPRGTFHSDFLAAAQAKALAENKPLAVLYTDKDTSCGLCRNATDLMADALRSQAIFVYAKDLRDFPRQVGQEFSARGKYIPKVAVFDAGLTECYGLVTYEEVKAEGVRALRELKQKF
jgi:hypothetical protein